MKSESKLMPIIGVTVMLSIVLVFALQGDKPLFTSRFDRLDRRVTQLEHRITTLEAKTNDRLKKMMIDINNNSVGHNDIAKKFYVGINTEGIMLGNQCYNRVCHGVNTSKGE